MRTNEISSSDDTINSSDVIKRIAYLEELKEALDEANTELDEAEALVLELARKSDPGLPDAIDARNDAEMATDSTELDFGEEEASELKDLLLLQEQSEGYCDWIHGVTLIREDAIKDVIRSEQQDMHSNELESLPAYIRDNIDWNGVVEDLKSDYTQVDFQGETYYVQ